MFKKALLFGTLMIGASRALEICSTDINVSILPRNGVNSWAEGLLTKTILDIDIKSNTCNLVDLELALNIPVGCVISSSWNLELDGLSAKVSKLLNKPGLILACPTKKTPTVSVAVSLALCSSACSTQPPTTMAPTTKAPTTKAPTTQAPTTKAPTTKAPTTKAPTTQAPTTKAPKKIDEVANFDDIFTLPTLGTAQVPVPYNALAFPGFSVLQTIRSVTPGVYPESGNQYAVSEVRTVLLQGEASMTSIYAGSNVKSFDLKSLYLGCALVTGNGATSTPQECNVFIRGYKKNSDACSDAPIVYQATFKPPSILAATDLTLVTLPKTFSNLESVKFTYVFPSPLNVLDGLLGFAIDTVKYSVTLN